MSPKSSTALPRYGSAEPSRIVRPKGIKSSDGEVACRLLKRGGLNLLAWQRGVLDLWLSKTGDAWSAGAVGLSVPRQNGKTAVTVGRGAWEALANGGWVLYTSQLQKTSTETFEEYRAFFETPAMSKYVKELKTALGREEITLTTGGRIKFLARTRNGGRGQHADLLIFDEAQTLDDTAQASFLPCLAASKNPQTVYIGTPPDENESGEVFSRIRSEALSGTTTNVAWMEWAVEKWDGVSNADPAIWASVNPSYGHLIRRSTIENEHSQMSPDKFARERLGWWSPVKKAAHIIEPQEWRRCKVEIAPRGATCYAVKFSPDGATVSLSVAVKPDEGAAFVECIENRNTAQGVQWLVDWLVQRKEKASQIVVDGKGGAQALLDRLRERGVSSSTLIYPSTRDVIAANSAFLNAVREQTVTHAGQPGLEASATMTLRRKIGNDGGWGFESTDEADASLVESAALAFWSVQTTKRKPGRKAIVI